MLQCYLSRGARPHERVKHNITDTATSEDAQFNQCSGESGEVRTFVFTDRNIPYVRAQLGFPVSSRNPNSIAIKIVPVPLRKQEYMLVTSNKSVTHTFRRVIWFRLDNILAQIPACILHSECETPRNPHQLLIFEAVQLQQLFAPVWSAFLGHPTLIIAV